MSNTPLVNANARFRHPGRILALVLFVCVQAFPASLKDTADQYFIDLGTAVSTIAAGKAIRSPKTSVTSAYFVASLKKHPTIYSLLRANAKGFIINEAIRGQTPKKVSRNVTAQQWFKQTAAAKEDINGLLQDKDKGRFYLFWVKPITVTNKAKKEVLSFAVAAKIDLWDCFEVLSHKSTTPFQVRLNNTTLYEDDWKDTIKYTEEPLTIPGVEKISLRIPRIEIPPATPDSAKLAADSALIKAQQDSIAKAKTPVSKKGIQGTVKKYYIAIAIGIVLIALFIGFWFYSWFSQWLIKRRIDKEESYKFK